MFIPGVQRQKVIIVGNGFDLSLGLKTAYSDFLHSSEFQEMIRSSNRICLELKMKHDLQKWIDVENELAIISAQLDTEDIEDEFEQLKKSLCAYLNNIDYSKINVDSKAYKFLMDMVSTSYVIYNFNYTDSVKLILAREGMTQFELNENVIMVHGSCESNNIIFGVEDTAATMPKDIYMKKSSNLHIEPLDLNRIVLNNTTLHIFGHSLGQTDHSYFTSFFESRTLNERGTTAPISIYHYGRLGKNQIFHQLDILTGHRMIKFRQMNFFGMIDASK